MNFEKFNTGTLFLVRTPDVFPEGYADRCFADMKHNLHFDFAALLETWNCFDGITWKSDKFPRSSYWSGQERDPVEECFQAADKYGMAFLPEVGVMHDAFMWANRDAMQTSYEGNVSRYSRIGLSPCCPAALDYLVEKYDTLFDTFGHHKSFQGICMPCENGIRISYDRYTREAWNAEFGTEMPSPKEMAACKATEQQVFHFLENRFLEMYQKLARYLKQKYQLPLMHYPLDKISSDSFFQPTWVCPGGNITLMNRVEELDMLNLQIHPPLNPNPYFFKMEAEFLMANSGGKPCMTDTHFYHESNAGRLPDMTPKRTVDSILSSLTPYGISFFCYGFLAEELPMWKKELNPGAPVYQAYQEAHTVAARREMGLKAMGYVELLRPMMEFTAHKADCAIYYPEGLNNEYLFSSYPLEHIFGVHELFNAAGIPAKMTDCIPATPQEQKLLVLDSVRQLSPEDATRLRGYLAAGGNVLIIGKCCAEIEEIAGLSVSLSEGIYIRQETAGDYANCLIRLPIDGRHYSEANGEPILCYDDGTPAVTRKGNVLYFGAADEVGRFGQYRDFRLAAWWRDTFRAQGLDSGVQFDNVYVQRENGHQFVSCDLFGNEEKTLLLLRNYGVEQISSTLHWAIPAGMKLSGAWADGKEFAFEEGKPLPKFEHFVAVFAVKE